LTGYSLPSNEQRRSTDVTHTHTYRSELTWSGSTADGYASYHRGHRVGVPPAAAELELSSNRAFGGNPELANPEQLLLAAASSCQLLSFLAIAARSRVDVLAYHDAAEAAMPEGQKPMRITSVVLRPRITVAPGTDVARVRRLVQLAHDGCFVANTLNAEMSIEPTIQHAAE